MTAGVLLKLGFDIEHGRAPEICKKQTRALSEMQGFDSGTHPVDKNVAL
jgi:hypothetical protein